MTMQSKAAMFLLGASLALGFALSSYMLSSAIIKFKKDEMIRVKGSASQMVKSDFGIWEGSIVVRSPELATAHDALAAAKPKLEAFVKAAGFEQSEFNFDRIIIREEYARDAKGNLLNRIENYVLTQGVNVSSAKVEQIEKLSRSFTELIKDGIYVNAQSPAFIVTKLDQYKMDLLAKATKNGYERAQVLAGSSGGNVGQLVSASQGVFQITRPASGELSDEGEYDKSTIEKEVKAVVTLEFSIK